MNKQKKPKLKLNRKYLIYISNFLIISGVIYLFLIFFPIIKPEIEYQLHRLFKSNNQESSNLNSDESTNSVKIPIEKPLSVTPVSTEFGIIIEKINLNTDFQPDIDISTREGYWQALENGVAHAKGTKYPAQIGNAYLFAHSTVDPLNISKYNAVFTLLHQLEKGDSIVTFYKGTRYNYIVDSKDIVDPTNIEPLTRDFAEPVITLQTCYPPGTSLKRLIITAKMEE